MESVNNEQYEILTSHKQLNLEEIQNNNIIESNEDEENEEVNSDSTITKKKTELIAFLNAYQYSIFGNKILLVYPKIFENLGSYNENELEERLNSIKLLIQQKNNVKFTKQVFVPIMKTYEAFTQLIGFNTKGIADTMSNNEDILETLEEIRLKYFHIQYVEPEYRLLFSIGLSTLTLHNMNNLNQSINSKITNYLDEKVSENKAKITSILSENA